MANMVPSRLGQINEAGDAKALFLKVFAGEVLTAFSETNVFMPRHMLRTISSGKSAQFPATWKGTAGYHTPGVQLVGTTIPKAERTISIDDMLVADRFISNIDEAMTHFEVRSEYSRDIGRALARAFDDNVARVSILAARAAATVTGGDGGSVLTAATALSDVAVLIDQINAAAVILDEKDVPEEDRYAYVLPEQYYALANSDLVHKDFTTDNGGRDSGTIRTVAGIEIVKTNHLPQTNVTTGPAAYQGNFTTVAALVSQKRAVGTVKLIELAVESEYLIEYQGDLMVGKYAVGHGVLRPECAVEIRTAAPT